VNRVSNISSPADIALEHEREGLRDRRSLRRRGMLLTWAKVGGSAAGLGYLLLHLLPILRSTIF
jgi:hypothetical protein